MVDDELRKSLHERLDQMLDLRDKISVPIENYLGQLALVGSHWRINDAQAAVGLFNAAIAFTRDLLGEPVIAAALPRTYEDDSEQRGLLVTWLTSVLPLLSARPQFLLGRAPFRELTIYEVLNALSALDAGEIQPLFVAKTGKNRRPNRWTLTQAKLQALVWKKRLEALGYSGKAASYEITLAFGEQWDTIRRWRGQCDEILGKNHVDWTLLMAGNANDFYVRQPRSGMMGAFRLDPMRSLKQAGENYRAELVRSAELSKTKSRNVS